MKAILTAGGTAGHINPALAIAKEITAHGGEVMFIGKEGGMEQELIPKEGFEIKCIKVSGLKRALSVQNVTALWQAANAMKIAAGYIKDFKPDIVIGCGGYVSGPAVYMAQKMKIPTLIHEQNAFPGKTTKMLAKSASAVCISFEESRKFFKSKDNIIFTGNPVRGNILQMSYAEARRRLNVSRTLVLVFGGSLGAQKINDVMSQFIFDTENKFDVIWGTGKRSYDDVMKSFEGKEIPQNVKIMPYIYNMDEVMSAADIVISRAGAITIGEICAKGKCSILIPSPNVANNHQEYNARALEKNGAAELITENEFSEKVLKKKITELAQNPEKIAAMQEKALKMGTPLAAKNIYKHIEKLISK